MIFFFLSVGPISSKRLLLNVLMRGRLSPAERNLRLHLFDPLAMVSLSEHKIITASQKSQV